MACPRCGTLTGRVHGYHRRRLADLPVGGRPMMIELAVRRLVCFRGQWLQVRCPRKWEPSTPCSRAAVQPCSRASAHSQIPKEIDQ
ncbi:transposase family protein [Frankia sp. CiP3]|uniref:transposase family protein n=1 Tax=Frankia sp. CiP3 TaxID=2880971 RepID=UPI0035B3C8BD